MCRLLLHLLFELLDASLDPWVSEGVLRRHSFIWFPLEAVIDKVDKVALIFVSLHQLGQVLGIYLTHLALGVGLLERAVVIVEEDLAPGGDNYHGSRRDALDLHDALHLFFLVLAGKDWETDEELVEDAAERPHVDSWSVTDTHHDLGRAVEPRLNVGVELILLISTGAKVNNFNAALVALS